jgi:hypothetical protein
VFLRVLMYLGPCGVLILVPPSPLWQVLLLGAGQGDQKHEFTKAKEWGMTGWVRPLMSIMMDGASGKYTHCTDAQTLNSTSFITTYHFLNAYVFKLESYKCFYRFKHAS